MPPKNSSRQTGDKFMPETPISRDSNVRKPSTPSGIDNNQTKLFRASQRLGTARKNAAVTPHGRAAQRELELRRVGLTPRRGLRKSGVQLLKETPRDDLRALSRLLAAKSHPIINTPSATTLLRAREDDEDEAIARPRFSLALEQEGDEDDSLLLPPKSAGLEDDNENSTVQSVELARRFFDGKPTRRLSCGSFGSVRNNDAFYDTSVLDPKAHTQEISRLDDFNAEDLNNITTNYEVLGEDTGTLRMIKMNEARFSFVGRESGIRPLKLTSDDNDTFALKVPPREVSEELPSRQDDNLNESEIDEPGEDYRISGCEEADNPTKLVSVVDSSAPELTTPENISRKIRSMGSKEKKLRVSKYGIPYPSLPARVVKQLATNFARTSGNGKGKINKETLEAIMQATDWFFEQVADDLRAYANHAGRKTINDSDVVALMHRQRLTSTTTTPFFLAQRYLPRELVQELRMNTSTTLNSF